MICDKCGKRIDDDAIYCNYCGSRVSGEDFDQSGRSPDEGSRQNYSSGRRQSSRNMRTGVFPQMGPDVPVLVSAPFYADKYEMKTDLQSKGDNWTEPRMNPASLFLYLLALGYLGLEVYAIITERIIKPEDIISYLFLNLLIPLALFAAGVIIQQLSNIRRYLELLSDGQQIKGTISISEKNMEQK